MIVQEGERGRARKFDSERRPGLPEASVRQNVGADGGRRRGGRLGPVLPNAAGMVWTGVQAT